jgi:hypothetical protein
MPQTCNVLAASDACASGQHCALDGTTEHPWVPVAGCVASGSAREGEPCLAQTDCGAGLSCTRFFATADPHGRMYFTSTLDETPMENQHRCMRVCNEHGDWAETECGAGQWCHPIVQTDAMAGTTIDGTMIFSGYGACAEPLPEGALTP